MKVRQTDGQMYGQTERDRKGDDSIIPFLNYYSNISLCNNTGNLILKRFKCSHLNNKNHNDDKKNKTTDIVTCG